MKRSAFYRNLFNSKTGFFQPKNDKVSGLSHLTLFGLEDRVDEIFIRKIMDGIIHGMFYMILKA